MHRCSSPPTACSVCYQLNILFNQLPSRDRKLRPRPTEVGPETWQIYDAGFSSQQSSSASVARSLQQRLHNDGDVSPIIRHLILHPSPQPGQRRFRRASNCECDLVMRSVAFVCVCASACLSCSGSNF